MAKPVEASMVATLGLLDAQVRVPKVEAGVPSVNVPVAVYWKVAAGLMGGVVFNAMESKTGAVTINVAPLDVMLPEVAVMDVVPCVRVAAMPLALTVAMAVSLDAQVTEPERSPVEPSLYVPVAVNVVGSPLAILVAAGLTLMLLRVGAGVPLPPPPPPPLPPQAATASTVNATKIQLHARREGPLPI